MLSTEEKQNIVTEFGNNPQDTGNIEVQIALLTSRIKGLAPHFEANKHDYSSKRGLMKLIGQRRRSLRYLANQNQDRYQALIKKLGLRK